MKNLLLIITVFIMPFTAFSQKISGIVLDADSNKPIAFAGLYFPDLNRGSITDEDGKFELRDAPNRNIQIIISTIGYETISRTLNFNSSKSNIFKLKKSHFALKEVIVSVPKGTLQNENVISIEQRSIKDLKEKAPLTLAEAISNVPGVDQNSTGSGIGKPVIRGLSGSRIVTYTQGIRLENQQWGSEHGLGVGDIGIEGVEVIKGPASLLYGADALGGVLYFNDAKYAKHNSIEGFIESKFMSNSLASYNNAGIKFSKNGFSVNAFGAINSSADYQVPGGESVFNTRFDEENFKTSIGYSIANWVTNLRYSYLKNNFGITEDDSLYTSSPQRDFELPFQTIVNNNLSFENTLFTGDSKFNLVLGYTSNSRKEFEDDKNSASLNMLLQTYTYNLKWYSPTLNDRWSLILGSQGMLQKNDNYGEEMLIPNATTKDIGLFSMINYKIGNLSLQGGLRIDNRNIDSYSFTDENGNVLFPDFNKSFMGVNYSIGAAYVKDKSTFRANISSGFRAPNTTELLAFGEHDGSNQFLRGDKDLESENANQIDFEYDYTGEHLQFSVNPFVNKINNYIYLDPSKDVVDGVPAYDYKQTGAILYGGEVGIHYHPHIIHWLHISSNLSTVFAEDDNGNDLPLIPQSRINSTVRAEFNQSSKLRINSVFIQDVYKFSQDRTGLFETDTPSYNLVNVGAEFEIANKTLPIQITTGVKNIFNTKYTDHLSRLKPLNIQNQGINFYIGLKFDFERNI